MDVDVPPVFTSTATVAATAAAQRCADKHRVDLAFEPVLGFAEQTAAAWLSTQLWLGLEASSRGPTHRGAKAACTCQWDPC